MQETCRSGATFMHQVMKGKRRQGKIRMSSSTHRRTFWLLRSSTVLQLEELLIGTGSLFATPTCTTLFYLINMLHNVLIFWKSPTCTPLFHHAYLSILENFQAKAFFIVINFGKFLPEWPYSILHTYWFWRFFHPASLFHPARLLDRLE